MSDTYKKFVIIELKQKPKIKLVTPVKRLVNFEKISKGLSQNQFPTEHVFFYCDSNENADPNFEVEYTNQPYDPAIPAIRKGLIAKGIFETAEEAKEHLNKRLSFPPIRTSSLQKSDVELQSIVKRQTTAETRKKNQLESKQKKTAAQKNHLYIMQAISEKVKNTDVTNQLKSDSSIKKSKKKSKSHQKAKTSNKMDLNSVPNATHDEDYDETATIKSKKSTKPVSSLTLDMPMLNIDPSNEHNFAPIQNDHEETATIKSKKSTKPVSSLTLDMPMLNIDPSNEHNFAPIQNDHEETATIKSKKSTKPVSSLTLDMPMLNIDPSNEHNFAPIQNDHEETATIKSKKSTKPVSSLTLDMPMLNIDPSNEHNFAPIQNDHEETATIKSKKSTKPVSSLTLDMPMLNIDPSNEHNFAPIQNDHEETATIKSKKSTKPVSSLTLDIPVLNIDSSNAHNFEPITPGDITFCLEDVTEQTSNNELLCLFEKESQITDHDALLKKCSKLEKQNQYLIKQNSKLQKQKDEHERLNNIYQKRYLACICKNLPTPEPSEARQFSSVAAPQATQQEAKGIDLTSTQHALLGRHINPTLKLGMLVGDLAVMLFSEEELQTKTASSLDKDKLIFMMDYITTTAGFPITDSILNQKLNKKMANCRRPQKGGKQPPTKRTAKATQRVNKKRKLSSPVDVSAFLVQKTTTDEVEDASLVTQEHENHPNIVPQKEIVDEGNVSEGNVSEGSVSEGSDSEGLSDSDLSE